MDDKKHLQLPNELIALDIISPKDLLVYLALKRFENWETHTAFPSLKSVAELCGCDSKTVSACIKRLESTNYLKVEKKGRGKLYHFLKYNNFEPFSLEFLDNKDLSFTEKAYLVAQQQFLVKEDNLGKTTYSSYEMSEKIHMSPSVIQRCDKALQAKDYLTIVKTNQKDPETGLLKTEKIFDLVKFGQAVVFVLKDHEESIEKLKEKTKSLEKTQSILINEINRLRKEKGEDEISFIM